MHTRTGEVPPPLSAQLPLPIHALFKRPRQLQDFVSVYGLLTCGNNLAHKLPSSNLLGMERMPIARSPFGGDDINNNRRERLSVLVFGLG